MPRVGRPLHSSTVTLNASRTTHHGAPRHDMSDLLFLIAAIGFTLLAIAYTHGCEKLRRGSHD